MRVPLSWLKEYVELTLPPERLAEQLTFAGLEVEQMDYIGLPAPTHAPVKVNPGLAWDRDRIFVGQLLAVEPHPNADRLTLAVVDYGQATPIRVVTGAPNIRVGDRGQKVALALEGTRLYDGHKPGRELMTLKKSKIRGVESGSMVCSEKELGISDEHEGIILLPEDAPVGTPLADYMGDIVYDIKINPNMARAQSVLGIAREVAALTGETVRLPVQGMDPARDPDPRAFPPETEWVEIRIEDPRLCARYSARLIRDVALRASPFWMQRRLLLAGMRPISNIVDITNYVMLEWGQPLHAFDYDRLVERAGAKRPEIIVRAAQPGERMQTLDGVTRPLSPEDLLITDTAGPIAIAGVMGGAETEVGDTTRHVLLESANFDFISVRRTTQAQKLPSEAATRFGRGVAPVLTLPAAQRAADLMAQWAGGRIEPATADNYAAPYVSPAIEITAAEMERQIGVAIPSERIVAILRSLDFAVDPAGPDAGALQTAWRVSPPAYRLDVDGPEDVLEEIARIYGYENIPSTLIADALPPLRGNESLEREEETRNLLMDAGLQEVITYVFTTPEREALLTLPGASAPGAAGDGVAYDPRPARPYVMIENPLSPDRAAMRQTLLPGVLRVLADNWRQRERLAIFEIGPVYLYPQGDAERAQVTQLPEDRGLNLPLEPRRLGVALMGRREMPSWTTPARAAGGDSALFDFFDLKGTLEAVFEGLHLAGAVRYVPARHPSFHPGRSATVFLGDQPAGVFGELHPLVRSRFDLPDQVVLAGEFDLETILARIPTKYVIRSLSRYPAVMQDLALVVDADLPAQRVTDLVRETGGALLTRLDLFDVYQGAPVPDGKKSLAYALVFQAPDRVLSDADVGKLRDKIVARAGREFGAELRA